MTTDHQCTPTSVCPSASMCGCLHFLALLPNTPPPPSRPLGPYRTPTGGLIVAGRFAAHSLFFSVELIYRSMPLCFSNS